MGVAATLPEFGARALLFIFSTNKVAAEEVPWWIPLEQKIVKDIF